MTSCREQCGICPGSNGFCSSVPSQLRERLCASAHRVRYKKRNEQVMFLDFRYVLVIESGYVLISRGHRSERQQGTDIVGPGNIVGIAQLLHPDLDSVINLLPLTPVEGCLVSLKTLEGLIDESPALGRLLIAEFSERFGRVTGTLYIDGDLAADAEVYSTSSLYVGGDVTGKLTIHSYGSARERLEFSVERVRELGLESEVRQEDLACLAGLSRVTVNRLLNADRPFAR